MYGAGGFGRTFDSFFIFQSSHFSLSNDVKYDQYSYHLQKMIGTTPDGGIGPATLQKLKEYVDDQGVDHTIKL